MTVTVHRAAWLLPVAGPPVRDGAVSETNGRVLAAGPADQVRAGLGPHHTVEHRGVLMPGLVNAHAHLQYGPGFADLAGAGLPFPRWIAELTARRARTGDGTWLAEARASAGLLLATGTTCVADVVSNLAALPGRGPLAGISYVEAVGADDAVWADRERERVHDGLRRARAAPGDGAAGLSPHSPYTLGPRVFAEVVRLARGEGLRLHPHLAESQAEVQYIGLGTGPIAEAWQRLGLDMDHRPAGLSPARYLDTLGGLGPDVHVAHGVHLDAADRLLLRERGTPVALCARSNAALRAGRAPVAAYRAEGSPVAVGTDSLASGPDLDLLAELRALRDLCLAQGSPAAGLDRWLVEAATVGGARALGLAGTVGELVPGARADLAVVQGEDPDPYTAVVHGRAVATYLAGRRVHPR